MLTSTLGHIFAVAVGLSLGLLGGGGSILAVPILIYVMGVGTKEAIAISLVSVGVVSSIGAISHGLEGKVKLNVALIFAPAAMLGAYFGAHLASFPWISETFQLICFGVTMLLASLLMIYQTRQRHRKELNKKLLDNYIYHAPKEASLLHFSMLPVEGLGIGVLTGFVGIGGGFAIVPALVLMAKIPMKQAVGTSLLIISLKSVTGFLGYLGQIDISWELTVSFTLAATLGTLVGTYLNKFINASVLQASFGYFVLLSAILILIN
ncbi:MAG: sulfite exporter TauE/SafE family protein [Leptolyngbyaceae cyanobacterium MO_188.B28]|nr:sulfite exporter TauE/SafE family protein [Leptolyngbyaceae cyanobacterium MO_188.B28]